MVSRSPRPAAVTEKEQSESPTFLPSVGVVRFLLIVAVFLVLATSLALYSQVFDNELSGETDEAAHYVTALMIHDYIANGLSQPPMKFAANYYLHYPKVALGHWPPMFYVLQAGLMFILGTSTSTSLILLLTMAATLAALICLVIWREFGSLIAGLACGALFLMIPVVQHYSRMVMSDIPVAALVFAATLLWAEFMNSGRRSHAIGFALFASAAILTKGNGYALVAVPAVTILLCRRWDLLLNGSVWLAGVIAGVLTVPWNIITHNLIVPTMQFDSGGAFLVQATSYYLQKFAILAGPVVPVLALLGIATKVILPWSRRTIAPIWASLFGLLIGIHLLHSLIPAGLEVRYLLGSFAALMPFMVAGILQIASWMQRTVQPKYSIAVSAAIVAASFFLTVFEIPSKPSYGYDEVAEQIVHATGQPGARVLIVSDADGEGLLISEVAKRETSRPGRTVVRSTQMCARMGWNGDNYQTLVRNTNEVKELLDAIPVEVVVFDRKNPGRPNWEHTALLAAAVLNSAQWSKQGVFPKTRKRGSVADSQIEIYQRVGAVPANTRGLRVDLNGSPKIRLNSAE